MKPLLLVFALTAAVYGQSTAALKAPTALTPVSATKSEVQIKWTGEGGAFLVERKPLGEIGRAHV